MWTSFQGSSFRWSTEVSRVLIAEPSAQKKVWLVDHPSQVTGLVTLGVGPGPILTPSVSKPNRRLGRSVTHSPGAVPALLAEVASAGGRESSETSQLPDTLLSEMCVVGDPEERGPAATL